MKFFTLAERDCESNQHAYYRMLWAQSHHKDEKTESARSSFDDKWIRLTSDEIVSSYSKLIYNFLNNELLTNKITINFYDLVEWRMNGGWNNES